MADWNNLYHLQPTTSQSTKNDANGRRPSPSRLIFLRGDDTKRAPDDQTVVVEGVAHKGSITLVYGKPKSGKSFLATDLARAVADAERVRWMGQEIVAHGPVLYIACEGHGGFWKRMRADPATVPPDFVLALGRPTLIQTFDNGRSYVPHPDDINAAIKHVEETCGQPPIMVVIDTVFRSFGGGNVNASDHMNAYIASATEVADKGIAVILVHHATKANGTPAGSVVLMGAADTLIPVEKLKDGKHQWQVEEAKDDADTPPRQFELEIVNVGVDVRGRPVTSCAVIDRGAAEPNPAEEPRRGRKPNEQRLGIVHRVLHDLTERATDGRVAFGLWRQECCRRWDPEEKPETQKKRFERERQALVEAGKVGVLDGFAWPLESVRDRMGQNGTEL